ncbi:helix-turn-helix domain-containing protein [Laspinema olomoucense]|uniref:Helix-turn-helix domain-containing protein n=1 Tax=Laspinema olomoucense D3b TaxID=2953688 RepID=A0ABT2NF96_9CYAN|nr:MULTISPECIES: helix-turn-helix domain-containing protein [unclassified Laspinema]MCT7981166.1 helix-turn-helix domain-containing protein [Laspinema sp. D3b]MCT7988214.1 helix-turn-helix domain-containing protein [Laspinema sp. D3a]
MANTLKLDIKEPAEDLKTRFKKETNAQKKERLHALYLLKSGKVSTLESLSRLLSRDTSTLYRWFQKYKNEGLDGLLKVYKPAGRPITIPAEALEKLKLRIQSDEGFKSYGEIQSWLKEACGVDVDYHVVYRAVRYKFKGKFKSTRRSRPRRNPPLSTLQLSSFK